MMHPPTLTPPRALSALARLIVSLLPAPIATEARRADCLVLMGMGLTGVIDCIARKSARKSGHASASPAHS